MRKFLLLIIAIVVACSTAMAVPAKPGLNTLTMSDGSTLQVQVIGDEWNHSLATADGLTIALGDDGLFYYVVSGDISDVRVHEVADRSATELSFVNANKDQMTLAALREAKEQTGRMRASSPRGISLKATQVPNNGSPRVPIILVQYTDKSMSNTKSQFEAHYKTDAKSVFNYFKDQSNGLYTPQFDIYGIYTLPSSRATYGGNDNSGNDQGVAKMVGDAITKAGNDINWAQYDNDGDGEADVCIVVYAGVGEAQAYGVVPNAVWPCQWSLSSGAYYGDGSGAVTRNGVTIDKFAVFNEVAGSSDSGTTLDGIGTFCHEFSHCLGLPDFYETTYNNGYFGMSWWSLMDTGCYNGGSVDGDTPIGYSAYEKNFMGWLNYIEATENTFYTLPVFNSKTAENDKAVRITALNSNEYWILENRKKQNWDYYIQDEGILITHFTYVASRWSANTVNNQSVQLATIIPADNSLSTNNLNKDLYGETNHAFGPATTPAMKANMSASGSLSSSTGGAGTVDKPVTEINLNSDGTASFWYIKGEVQNPTISVSTNSLAFEGYSGETYTKTFTVSGINLTGNISISKQGSSYFTVSPTTITASNASTGVQVTVTYKPTTTGNTNAILTLSSTGAESVTVNVSGTAQEKVPTITVDPTSLSFSSNLSSTVTKTVNVTGLFLTNNVTVTLNDNNGVFSVSPTTITAANAANGVPVTVSFSSAEEGNFTGSLTFTSNGAESKTVQLTAQANDGGTASDAYLNIAKYATIDEAGATVSGMSKIYGYTEYPNDGCAWLTIDTYGAMKADANQNWLATTSLTQYNNSWDATDIFQGQTYYFGSNQAYSIYGSGNQVFYVTNCTQAKALVKDGSSYKATLAVYECTLNADGTVTASNTAVSSQQGGASGLAVITSATLDASKIYKVQLTGGGSYPDLLEVAFQTPVEAIETPVATDATEVGTNEFTANWNACADAQSYTLRVMPKPEAPTYTLLLSEGFSKCTTEGTNDVGNSLNNYMDNAGWTGSGVYTAVGGLRLGARRSTGSITSPALDLTGSNGKVSIVYKAKTYNNDTNCGLKITCGSSSETVTIPNSTEAEYTQVLSCTTAAGQNVSFASIANQKRVIITSIEIYAGDITAGASKEAGEMLFPGITDTHYIVTGLEPATTYIYDVKAVYAGNKESNWSNQIEVTTLEEQGTTLAEILEIGVDDEEYIVSNDLAVADVADYANYAFVTDGQGNWIRIDAPSNEMLQPFLDNQYIKGGTIKGVLSGMGQNPVLTINSLAETTENVVDFEIERLYLTDTFAPKVNQVIDVVGWWNASDGALRAYEPGNGAQGMSLTLDTSWGASSNTLQNGKRYEVRCAINIKEPWSTKSGIHLMDYDYDFQNYLGYALRMPDAPTAIGTIGLDSYNTIVNVYNAQGQLIRMGVKAGEATRNLPRGIYIVGNRKVVVK
ncbi:MAG: M6 family metalloprotease domain-containing protein [Muribaculaceae bacterium]|nr:M6 family metalloprotease domain-containing protein [Muribaculaceae bacterium]